MTFGPYCYSSSTLSGNYTWANLPPMPSFKFHIKTMENGITKDRVSRGTTK